MRIVHATMSDDAGGAALAVYRLHRGMSACDGVESTLLVRVRGTDDPAVTAVSPAGLRAWWHDMTNRFWAKAYGAPRIVPERGGFPAWHRHEAVQRADVLGLYALPHSGLSPRRLAALAGLDKPAYWRLSDMWPFTGGCHYARGCRRFEAGCGRCPQMKRGHARDITHWQCRRKQSAIAKWQAPFAVVSPSRWLKEEAERSVVFRNVEVRHIPTGVSFEQPLLDTRTARRCLGLPQDRRVILFPGFRCREDPRKGGAHVFEAIGMLAEDAEFAERTELWLMGSWNDRERSVPIPVRAFGQCRPDFAAGLLYSAADLVVVPSLQENSPNTIIEALARGRPVAAFETGGIPELVTPGFNGVLAKAGDSRQLADGLRALLDATCAPGGGAEIGASEAIRERTKQTHDLRVVVRQYLALCDELTDRRGGHL